MLDVGGIVMVVGTDQFLTRPDAHRREATKETRKGLRLGQLQKVKVQTVSTGINFQDMLSNIRIALERHFQGRQALSRGPLFSLLSKLDDGLPCSTGKFPVTFWALLPLYVEFHHDTLLHLYTIDIRTNGDSDFQSHRVWFRPDPNGIQYLYLGLSRLGLNKPRDAFQANAQQLRRFGFAWFKDSISAGKLSTLTTLMYRNEFTFGLQEFLEIKLLCHACTALIRIVRQNWNPAEATRDCNCSSLLWVVTHDESWWSYSYDVGTTMVSQRMVEEMSVDETWGVNRLLVPLTLSQSHPPPQDRENTIEGIRTVIVNILRDVLYILYCSSPSVLSSLSIAPLSHTSSLRTNLFLIM